MKNCPYCNTEKINKNGKTLKGVQRYQCKECKKHFIETIGTIYYGKHLTTNSIDKIIQAHCEGVGIRATGRLLDVSKNTVSKILVQAGTYVKHVHNEIMEDLPCEQLQLDEMWGFIKKN